VRVLNKTKRGGWGVEEEDWLALFAAFPKSAGFHIPSLHPVQASLPVYRGDTSIPPGCLNDLLFTD